MQFRKVLGDRVSARFFHLSRCCVSITNADARHPCRVRAGDVVFCVSDEDALLFFRSEGCDRLLDDFLPMAEVIAEEITADLREQEEDARSGFFDREEWQKKMARLGKWELLNAIFPEAFKAGIIYGELVRQRLAAKKEVSDE